MGAHFFAPPPNFYAELTAGSWVPERNRESRKARRAARRATLPACDIRRLPMRRFTVVVRHVPFGATSSLQFAYLGAVGPFQPRIPRELRSVTCQSVSRFGTKEVASLQVKRARLLDCDYWPESTNLPTLPSARSPSPPPVWPCRPDPPPAAAASGDPPVLIHHTGCGWRSGGGPRGSRNRPPRSRLPRDTIAAPAPPGRARK